MSGYERLGKTGVWKKVVKEGKGKTPKKGETVFAHYTGKLENGKIFDSSRGKPHRVDGFYFTLGAGDVIAGWDIGFASMNVGEVAVLKIDPEYGYGSSGIGSIPANSTLIFEVELLNSKTMTSSEREELDRRVASLRR
jgi:peptidylprolyl isomerase